MSVMLFVCFVDMSVMLFVFLSLSLSLSRQQRKVTTEPELSQFINEVYN